MSADGDGYTDDDRGATPLYLATRANSAAHHTADEMRAAVWKELAKTVGSPDALCRAAENLVDEIQMAVAQAVIETTPAPVGPGLG